MLYHCLLYSGVSPRAFLPGAVLPGVCTVVCTPGLAQQCGAILPSSAVPSCPPRSPGLVHRLGSHSLSPGLEGTWE